MGKKKRNKQRHSFLRDWGKSDIEVPTYEELIQPIKKLFFEGYQLTRKMTTYFNYMGHNIGSEELQSYPSPEERFSARWLDNESKNNRTLLDNIFEVVFQLGTEYGRRLERKKNFSLPFMQRLLECRTKEIGFLRTELAKYDERYNIYDVEIPFDSDDDDLFIDQIDLLASDIVEPEVDQSG